MENFHMYSFMVVDEAKGCSNCSSEFGIKFKCDYCSEIFCDICNEVKIKYHVTTIHLGLKFYCPTCDGTSTRILPPTHLKSHISGNTTRCKDLTSHSNKRPL